MQNIKKVIVHYENGQTDEWTGKGWLTQTKTTKKVETDELDSEGKRKTKTVPVQSVECQLTLESRE